MWFSKSSGTNRDFEAEFQELTAQIETTSQPIGPRDYTLSEPDEHFIPPAPDPLPSIRNRKAISLIVAVVLILILSGLGIAQIVLPVWGRIVFGVAILSCLGSGFYTQRKQLPKSDK